MPLLKFRCGDCGAVFDELVGASRLGRLDEVRCPGCGGVTERAYEGRCLFGMAGSDAGRGGCGGDCGGCAGCGGGRDG
ncbi:MAG: zinc ribbon domain-containing protein [Oscillospiraceae bacterium]|jgi:putative FmdB family regulatory protein|nr:zinc ribbon domain-containing protein [Oscillospiraceae bacterium]